MNLRDELDVPGDFPPDVLAEAEAAVGRPLPTHATDLRDIDFVTLDPPGSRDLDQAYAIERRPEEGGWRIRYAIADVAHFVDPGGAIDREAHRRGVTLYLPDGRAPLHPPVLSEGAASLLPDVDRPAVVWTLDVAADGTDGAVHVERAIVRSREQRAYETASDPLLQEVGEALEAAEARRGGVSLDLPAQEVTAQGDRWVLRTDAVLPIEGWNEQLSLLAGRAAARLMLDGGVGLLRTMPPPDEDVVRGLRVLAGALDLAWRADQTYADVVRSIDRTDRRGVVFLQHAVRAMRGAAYTAFDGAPPDISEHSAVAAPYAHVTAPLRRLADRHATEVALAHCAGAPIPAWARDELPALATLMVDANRKASTVERAVIDLAEAMTLAWCVGAVLDATVVSTGKAAIVAVHDPVVVARSEMDPSWRPGDAVSVRVVAADVERRRVELAPA
ncbi:MAG TPA: RNB domain-containing ribonuclease [Acidimicrobiales bacterium]|nr:RNB domain-containing ribonuclease [Acidimicrobiales bacterium]